MRTSLGVAIPKFYISFVFCPFTKHMVATLFSQKPLSHHFQCISNAHGLRTYMKREMKSIRMKKETSNSYKPSFNFSSAYGRIVFFQCPLLRRMLVWFPLFPFGSISNETSHVLMLLQQIKTSTFIKLFFSTVSFVLKLITEPKTLTHLHLCKLRN